MRTSAAAFAPVLSAIEGPLRQPLNIFTKSPIGTLTSCIKSTHPPITFTNQSGFPAASDPLIRYTSVAKNIFPGRTMRLFEAF